MIAAADYLHAARPSGPIIFVASKKGFTASDRAVRASLPGDLISSVHTFLGDSADLLAGEPINGFPNEDAELSWQMIAPLVDQDFTAIWLESLNPRSSPPEGSLSGAPGVWVVRGAPPPALATLAPLDVPDRRGVDLGELPDARAADDRGPGVGHRTGGRVMAGACRSLRRVRHRRPDPGRGGVRGRGLAAHRRSGDVRSSRCWLWAGWLLAGVVLRRDRHENASDDV